MHVPMTPLCVVFLFHFLKLCLFSLPSTFLQHQSVQNALQRLNLEGFGFPLGIQLVPECSG